MVTFYSMSRNISQYVGISFLWLLACSYPRGYKTVIEKNKYAIEVASYLTRTRDLSSTPGLQYHNRYRTVYLVVEDTYKSTTDESFEAYCEKVIEGFKKRFGNIQVYQLPDTQLNGQRAVLQEITLSTDGEEVWYYLAMVETQKRYYQICSWTIARRKDKYEQDIRHMVHSFKEI